MQELIDQFSLEKVSKSGARFSPDKAKWFNQQYMHVADDNELGEKLVAMLAEKNITATKERAAKAVSLIKERAIFPQDLLPLTIYMFEAPAEYDEKSVNKFWKADNVAKLRELREQLAAEAVITAEVTEPKIHQWVVDHEYSMGQLMNCLRIAIIGISQGPSIFAISEFIGREETLARIDKAIEALGEGK